MALKSDLTLLPRTENQLIMKHVEQDPMSVGQAFPRIIG